MAETLILTLLLLLAFTVGFILAGWLDNWSLLRNKK